MSTQSGKRLRIRRGNGTRILANGELEFDYVNSKLRVGDGSSVGGISIAGQSGFTLTRVSAGYVFPTPAVPGADWTGTITESIIRDSDAGAVDYFGRTVGVASEADVVAVGATGWDPYGSVVVFNKSGGSWSQTTRLQHSDAATSDQLGYSLDINSDGTYVIAGNPWDDDLTSGFNYTNQNLGSAYVFYYNGSSWSQQAKLTDGSDRGTNNFLGSDVGLNSDATYAIVGKQNQGVAFIFTRSGTSWSLQQKLSPSDVSTADYGGAAVDINADGTYAIVGAYGVEENSNLNDNNGAVYVFTRSGSTWTQQQKLTASDSQAGDQFGIECSISDDGDYIVVGALGEDGGSGDPTSASGAAYVFYRSGSTWSQQAKLTASDAQASDQFGHSVDISGDGTRVVVGAYLEDGGSGDPASNSGAAYVFKRDGTSWTEEKIILASDAQANDKFTERVRINKAGDTIISGADQEDGGSGDPLTNAGAAYIFEV